MADIARPVVATDRPEPQPNRSVTFPELVYAHFDWRRGAAGAVERYQRTVEAFERQHGPIVNSYWCSEVESAVALTAKPRRFLSWFLPPQFMFHALTDWATKGEADIAGQLHRCDELGVKASSVLSGLRQRVCMQLVTLSGGHLLSLVDARARHEDEKATKEALAEEQRRLKEVYSYYRAAANGQAQMVYFGGMALVAAALGVVSGLFWLQAGDRAFFGAIAAGAAGAVVSVLQRINARHFKLDFDRGDPYVFFLGGLRPVLGAVFGLATYFAFTSGLIALDLPGKPHTEQRFHAILVLAFVAGFNERWAQDTLAQAASGGSSQSGPPQTPPPSLGADQPEPTGDSTHLDDETAQ
jgi:hypothetical protein